MSVMSCVAAADVSAWNRRGGPHTAQLSGDSGGTVRCRTLVSPQHEGRWFNTPLMCVCVCVWVDTQNIMCGPTSQPSGEGLPRTEGTFSSARLQERRQHEGRLLQERDHTQTQNRQPQDGEETDPASTLSDGSLLLWLLTVRGQQQLYRERLTESKWLTPHRMFRTEAASKISELDVTIICRNKNKMHQQTSKSELVSVSICRLNMWTQVCSPLCCVPGAGKCTVDGKLRYHKHKHESYWTAAAAARSWRSPSESHTEHKEIYQHLF